MWRGGSKNKENIKGNNFGWNENHNYDWQLVYETKAERDPLLLKTKEWMQIKHQNQRRPSSEDHAHMRKSNEMQNEPLEIAKVLVAERNKKTRVPNKG